VTGRRQRTSWKRLLLGVTLLVAGLPSGSCASPGGALALELPVCCAAPDPGGCCPAEEGEGESSRLAPLCCGVEAPADEPVERGRAPARTVDDPIAASLCALVRGVSQPDLLACRLLSGSDRWRHAPARAARAGDPAALGGHWLTEREVLETLALLSVARL
jgi:hypothetical protein